MEIYIENQTKEYFNFRGYKKLIETVIHTAAEMKQVPDGYEVNVMIVDPETIKEINKETRDTDRVTDVLSFPYFDYETPGDTSVLEENEFDLILGDIVLCAEKVIAQAEEFGHSQKRELAYLVVHSMLHLVGYDHMVPEEEKEMTAEADKIMAVLGINR